MSALIFFLALDQDSAHALAKCSLSRRARASKWINDCATLRRDKPHEVLHQVERLDGGMLRAEPIVGISFGGVEKARGRTRIARILNRVLFRAYHLDLGR